MPLRTFERSIDLPVSAATAFAWHERPGALQRLIPPWEQATVLRASGGIQNGAQVELVTRLGPLRLKWLAEHSDYHPGRQFRDVQLRGPFAQWEHTHHFEPLGPAACRLTDRILYRIPAGGWGEYLAGRLVQTKLQQMFQHRHAVTAADLAAHAASAQKANMRILISGSSGLVGSTLIPLLTTGGHSVTRLVRKTPQAGEAQWNPADGQVDPAALASADAVVHLAGDNIGDGRWTAAKKDRILRSRVEGTQLLATALAKLPAPPKVLVCASAIGIYGDRGDEWLDEQSPPGQGFLADVCQQWEAAAQPAREAGIRVVNLRFGVILSPRGGALAKMLLPFRLGGGGVIGSGQQYWSWIALDDAVGAIHHAIVNDSLSGPVNVVAPQTVTNQEFTKTLGRVLHRPTIVPMPAFAARLALGEMANELLLASQRVRPSRLEETRYTFRHPQLEGALRAILGKNEN